MTGDRLADAHLDAWRALLNAHAAVVAAVEEELAAADLPPLGWYDVLWALRRAPRRRLRMHDLADSLTISRGGLSKLVDRLEREGLIRREPDPVDGRGLYAVLTEAGRRTLRAIWPVYSRVLSDVFSAELPETEARVVADALTRVRERARLSRARGPSARRGRGKAGPDGINRRCATASGSGGGRR